MFITVVNYTRVNHTQGPRGAGIVSTTGVMEWIIGHGFSEAVTRKSFLGPDSGVAVIVKPVPESPFYARIPEIATFFFFSFHVQINVRVGV